MGVEPREPRSGRGFAGKRAIQEGRRQSRMQEGVVVMAESRPGFLLYDSLQHILNVRTEGRPQRVRMLTGARIGRRLDDVDVSIRRRSGTIFGLGRVGHVTVWTAQDATDGEVRLFARCRCGTW